MAREKKKGMARPALLLADNEPDFLDPAKEFFFRAGYDVFCAASPAEAIKILKRQTVAAAFLDYRLKDDNDDADNSGLKLALELMEQFSLPRIIMTRFPKHQAAREALIKRDRGQQAALDFISKEEGLPKMLAVVNDILQKASIFLSYASEDQIRVKALFKKLRQAGFIPWMDKQDLVGGEQWREALRREIDSSDFFIPCISNISLNKRGIMQQEINLGFDQLQKKLPKDIYFIPVRLERLKYEIADPRFIDLEWINLYEKDGFQRLVRALREGINRRYPMGESM